MRRLDIEDFNARFYFLLSFSLFQVFAFSYFAYACLIRSLLICLVYFVYACLMLVFIHARFNPFPNLMLSFSSC